MVHFVLKPNQNIINNYIIFQDEIRTSGEVIVSMDYYHNETLIRECEDGFRILLAKYDLSKHYDNLLLLCLSGMQHYETVLYEADQYNTRRRRLKELAKLLVAYENINQSSDPVSLRLKGLQSAKVTDRVLCMYIGQLIKDNIVSDSYPVIDFGFDLSEFIDDTSGSRCISSVKIKDVAASKLLNINKLAKSQVCSICFTLLRYFNGETIYSREDDTNFSDSQLNVLYDILIHFNLLSERYFDKTADYEPKDYMRNYLMKYVKSL